jgi:hypothetical protein
MVFNIGWIYTWDCLTISVLDLNENDPTSHGEGLAKELVVESRHANSLLFL